MLLSDIISSNEDFQTSVNISFDFGSPEKVKSLIPTDTVCRYLEEILQDVIYPSTQRAKLMVGPYGKGKSHITLAAVSAMWEKTPELFERLVQGYRERGWHFEEIFQQFTDDGPQLLPVIVSGSSSDLRHSLLTALRSSLRFADLEDLMPKTNFNSALDVLERWRTQYPETLGRLESETGIEASALEVRLKNMETSAYEAFVDAYPHLTSGSVFDPTSDGNILDIYNEVLLGLKSRGISGIYVVYDEFSKYLEANIVETSIEDIKLLQDFAEMCSRSSQEMQLHLLLISHKSLSNYIDSRLPKEKVDGWRGVSGRFREIEIRDDADVSYELMASAIVKNKKLWTKWLEEDGSRRDLTLENVGAKYEQEGLFNAGVSGLIVFGCYPLHPVSAFLLPRMSEKVAQNERTLFTFLCSNEEHALPRILDKVDFYVSPDAIYDYFESLLRKERYGSPMHKIYELVQTTLRNVDGESLEARIIKTIAIISVVAQYDLIAPTRQTLVDVFSDCGFSEEEIATSIENLVSVNSVVYLRQSNSYLKLKETSGVRIDEKIKDRAELLKASLTGAQILNRCQLVSAMYPSRYNQEYDIIRYFDCGFVSCKELASKKDDPKLLEHANGDGSIIALYPESPDDLRGIADLAQEYTEASPMAVVVVPKSFSNIEDVLFRLAAARELKEESSDDEVLSEEYEIAIEDYSEIVDSFVEGYFRPELEQSTYYAGGTKKYKITRRRRLSELLSKLCEDQYPNTPNITSESLNKNELTGIARNSRSRILKGLCGTTLEPNLGFVGNGQEMSMMRSALERTGVIKDIARNPIVCLKPSGADGRKMRGVLETIEAFVESANGETFDALYQLLTGPENKIGMKSGPIPLYLALILREKRDEIMITRDGEERDFCAELLDEIDAKRDAYRVFRLNWTPQMANYTSALGTLFGCDSSTSRTQVAEAMRRWFVLLPQLTRNAQENHSLVERTVEQMKTHREFFRLLKKAEMNASELLFERIPNLFGETIDSPDLIERIADEKAFCEGYIASTTEALAHQVKMIVDPSAHADASLDSVLKDWLEQMPDAVKSHVFAGIDNQVLTAMRLTVPDHRQTIARLAKAATSLRIEDWNDDRCREFLEAITSLKERVDALTADKESALEVGDLGIVYLDEKGTKQIKTFDAVECSRRASLLRNSILASIDEMGQALSSEEKRQVVFDVLRSMC